MPVASNQGLGIFLALSELAHGLHSGLGITAVKVQIRWWPELESVSASGQCPVPQLIQYTVAKGRTQ